MDSLKEIIELIDKLLGLFISASRPLIQRIWLIGLTLFSLLIYDDMSGCSAKKDTEYKMVQIEKYNLYLKTHQK